DRRDLLVRQSFHVAQHHGVAELVRQLAHARAYARDEVALVRAVAGVALAARGLDEQVVRARDRRVDRHRRAPALLRAPAAVLRDRDVGGDRVDPGVEARAAV